MTTLEDEVTRLLIPLIREIIGEKKLGCKEVRAALKARGKDASESTIGKFAFAMGLKPRSGRRPGQKAPLGSKRLGRPPSEAHALHRLRARQLKAANPAKNNQEIADLLTQDLADRGESVRPFTREAIRQFLLCDDSSKK